MFDSLKLGLFTMKPALPVIFVLFFCLWLFAGAAIDARAATLTVTKTADTNDGVCDADCSLREAVAAAASGDTVVFSSVFNTPQTITLTLGQINITQNLMITGTGQDLVTISGNNAGRIFLVSGSLNVTMSGMNLRDGKVGNSNSDAQGGAIRVLNGNGTLNLSNMEFVNNVAFYEPNLFGKGAAVYCFGCTMTLANLNVHDNSGPAAGAIHVDAGTADIRDSVLSNNHGGMSAKTLNMMNTTVSGSEVGGLGSDNLTLVNSQVIGNGGRGIYVGNGPSTNATIENSIIAGNLDSGMSNSAITVIRNTLISNNHYFGPGAGIMNSGTMYVINSAIIGNIAAWHGGGIETSGRLFLTNSTVSGNIASGTSSTEGFGGGIIFDGFTSNDQITITNSTIFGNQSKGAGGGIKRISGGSITVRNSIIAGNTSTSTSEADASGTFNSQGNNLIGNTTGSSGWIAADLLNINPMLASLADNGGSTLTHALLPGSPAINAGNNSVAIDPQTQMALTSDQRGFLRFYGGTVDIGSYEVQPEITGTITYGNATGSPTPRFVSGVLLSALGSPSLTATSRADGTYTLGGFGSGAYTVTPSKTSGANGISSFDSGLIAKHVSGLQVLTGNQLVVADVSGNGTLSSFDAGQIARYTVGINGFGSSGNWVFVPASRTYSSLNSTQAGEDFIALLMGDVSGNWVNQ